VRQIVGGMAGVCWNGDKFKLR